MHSVYFYIHFCNTVCEKFPNSGIFPHIRAPGDRSQMADYGSWRQLCTLHLGVWDPEKDNLLPPPPLYSDSSKAEQYLTQTDDSLFSVIVTSMSSSY
jgi:hypothetical protein